jgi:K+-transporting ATPase ATPase C chain
MAVVTLVLTGLLYPLVTTGLAQVLFRSRANGSLVVDDQGRVVGSELLGQRFTGAAYLQPRPSAAGVDGYDAAASSGSNLGPTSRVLRKRVEKEIERLRRENPAAPAAIPADLVSASASGLDPHLSVPGARWQVERIAAARGVSPARVAGLIDAQVVGRDLGFLGEPRVSVLMANLALDRQFGRPR